MITGEGNNAVRWNEGERLHHIFERRCDLLRRAGEEGHEAIITGEVTLTYQELDQRANQVARYLIDQGIKPGDRIGLLFDKSYHTYVALLAVLKVDATYVPLDASYPQQRLEFILQDASVCVVVSHSSLAAHLTDLTVRKLFIDAEEHRIAQYSTDRLEQADQILAKDQLCYIVYTSGTTGNPKGVAIEHSSICNFVRVASEVYGYRQTDRVYQGLTIAFDFSVEELWVPLAVGATLVPGQPGASLVGEDLANYLINHRVTAFCCVPTLLATIEQDLPELRVLLVSGEACPRKLVQRWSRPGRIMLNAYGPTEATVTATLKELRSDKPVTIGRPLPTYTVVILNETEDEQLPEGEVGEIGIAGVGLAREYLNRLELTARKFIPDFLDLPNNPSGRIYRTGDLGRINDNGEVEFFGRIDTQVKLRGYRIELDEIEAVLLQHPHIAQAIVHTYELEPGRTELVAYYTLKRGRIDPAGQSLATALRRQLPAYMVPAFFVKLSCLPMSASNKVDRKSLPPPPAERFCNRQTGSPPRTQVEKRLAQALSAALQIDRVSVDDNFFSDLGGHSLLMARFAAEARKKFQNSTVSMRDIYLHPTLRKLAAFIESPADENAAVSRKPLRIPTDREHFTCGALQLLFYIGYGAMMIWALVEAHLWIYAGLDDIAASYARILFCSVAFFTVPTAIAVASKWLLIGRWKRESFPIWSLKYFRFWLVKTLIQSAPPVLFVGSPVYNFYLRLLGAKVGRHAVILSASVPACTDLISIGRRTILRKDSIFLGYRAQSNYIYTGRIEIGDDAFVGEATVLDIETAMGNKTQLGHSSSLQSGQRIPDGKRFHGSPARETTTDYCRLQGLHCTSLRRALYTAAQLIVPLFFLFPSLLLAIQHAAPLLTEYVGSSIPTELVAHHALPELALRSLEVSAALFFGSLLLGLLAIFAVPRLCNLLIRPGRTYVLYGMHYWLHRTIFSTSNSSFYTNLFGDSAAIIYYLRFLGYNLNTVVQTGSNFGSTQQHDNPFLCNIGSGTMVSDAISIINLDITNSSFRLRTTKIGDENYFGNKVHYPPDGKTGANCLFGTKVLVPIDGSVRQGVGLLGSPPFEIPRVVERDRQLAQRLTKSSIDKQLSRKNAHNFVTAMLFLLRGWVLSFVLLLSLYVCVENYASMGILAVWAFAGAFILFSILYVAAIERATLSFGRLEPRLVSIYDEYYWFHERHWKFCDLGFQLLFKGTPFKSLLMRLLGVKVGKKVFDDGCIFIEKTLVEVGDYCNLNAASTIQGHSLEEGVFKSDYIKIGRGCTVGCGAWIHYAVNMGDNVIVEPDSFLMKGESPDADTTWCGNPARALRKSSIVRVAKRKILPPSRRNGVCGLATPSAAGGGERGASTSVPLEHSQ